jgi:hypothetical protein
MRYKYNDQCLPSVLEFCNEARGAPWDIFGMMDGYAHSQTVELIILDSTFLLVMNPIREDTEFIKKIIRGFILKLDTYT